MEKLVKIVVEIDENGGFTMKADGFVGGACLTEIEALMKGANLAGSSITHTSGENDADGKTRNIQTNTQG